MNQTMMENKTETKLIEIAVLISFETDSVVMTVQILVKKIVELKIHFKTEIERLINISFKMQSIVV